MLSDDCISIVLAFSSRLEKTILKSLCFQKYPKTCGRSVNDTVNMILNTDRRPVYVASSTDLCLAPFLHLNDSNIKLASLQLLKVQISAFDVQERLKTLDRQSSDRVADPCILCRLMIT